MKLITIIETKDPRRITFLNKFQPLVDDVDMAIQSVSFMRGIIEDSLHDAELTDDEFNLLEYIRLALADNLDGTIDKANYYAREANRVLSTEAE